MITTHASYHSAMPLPSVVWCCLPAAGPIPAPRNGQGRVVRMDMDVERIPRTASEADIAKRSERSDIARNKILSAMQNSRWMTTQQIAMAAGIGADPVNKAMRRSYMTPLVENEMRLIDGRYRYVWRLK